MEATYYKALETRKLKEGSTAEEIIAAYEIEAENQERYTKENHRQPSLHLSVFDCRPPAFLGIKDYDQVYKGKISEPIPGDTIITQNSNGSFKFSSAKCRISNFDSQGTVSLKVLKSDCFDVGDNIFSKPPFFAICNNSKRQFSDFKYFSLITRITAFPFPMVSIKPLMRPLKPRSRLSRTMVMQRF